MRISTQSLFETSATRLGELQTGLARTQQQMATGLRILVPSDDPVAAARALEVTQSQSINTQYGRNRQYAKGTLGEVESRLSGVTSLIQDIKDTVIAAGNGTLGNTERGFQATELKGRFDELLNLANSRDAQGNYLFSGFQSGTPAFSPTLAPGVLYPGATYQGDAGQLKVQVDTSRQIAVSNPGSAVFQGGGQDIFKTLNDLIVQLQTPGTAGLTVTLTTAASNLDLALNNVLTIRASVGSSLQEIDALDSAGSDRDLQYSKSLSDLQDLDYNQAVSQLTQQKLTLEAAQQSFVQTSKLSLFNFI
jgi:flagellar hook-associated protein 3 FlgL